MDIITKYASAVNQALYWSPPADHRTATSVIADCHLLTKNEQAHVKSVLFGVSFVGATLKGFIEDKRFAGGRVCPHCGSVAVIRNGKRADGTQQFKCKDCGKRFVITTNTIAQGTRKVSDTWRKYVECMLNGFSLNHSAAVCGICYSTAFACQHKILDALQSMAEYFQLGGIVEAGETFFSPFPILEQVKGSYHTSKGIYGIQHINSYHSMLKLFIDQFRGVSTKYLNNYIIWHNFAKFKSGDWGSKCNKMLAYVLTSNFAERNADVANRPNSPTLVK